MTTLPATGEEASAVLSLLGAMLLGGTGFLKRKHYL